MNSNQNIPEESLPEKEPTQPPPAEISSATESIAESKDTASSTTKSNQEMEVHHHGHVHEQKKWKEYVFQFAMLFLAVFLGSLAENRREHGVEIEREKEYIESLMTDVDNDYKMSQDLEAAILQQVKNLDTLQSLFFSDLKNDPHKDSLVRKCYDLSANVLTFYPAFFNERTISQLLSSGTMRLIKKQGVADSIMDYHSFIKFLEVQKQLYITSINSCFQSMYNIYDISFSRSIMRNDTLFELDRTQMPVKLLTTDPTELKKFNAILETTKRIAFTYKGFLTEMVGKSDRLYIFLRDKYGTEKK